MPVSRLLTIANLVPRKRIDLCLSAGMVLQKRADMRWTIVGNGPLAESLSLNTYPFVEWIKRVPSLVDAYRTADGFVLPSEGEGFGMVYIESILCGCPVICRAFGAGEEIIRETGGGIAVGLRDRARESERLVDAIVELTENRSKYMNRRVLERALVFADRERLAGRWRESLRRLRRLEAGRSEV